MVRYRLLALFAAASVAAAPLAAQDDEAAEVTTTLIIKHLDNPTDVAVHEGGDVFVAAHQGVFRYRPGEPGKVYLEVDSFPTDVYGKGPKYDIGPLGLAFLDLDHLIVGGGSRPDGEELIHVFKIGGDPPAAPQTEADAVHTLGPVTGTEEIKPEGNFYGVAVASGSIFASANGDDTKGWVVEAEITDGAPGELVRSIATKEAVGVDAPVPVIVSPDGAELVVGQMGEVNLPGDSLLTFYNPADGSLIRSLGTSLSDIAGLAYSPSGKLYATDFSWVDPSKGALYRLDVEGEEVTAVKIIDLDRPAGLAFDKEGGLYVTVFGTGEETGDKPTGGLLYIPPGL